MDLIIRDVSESDLDAVLSLNQLEALNLSSLDLEQMRWFAANADYFRVAMGGESLAGYLVGFRPGTDYTSPNYLWFCERYNDFAYVDRVAVADFARRNGLATRLYKDFADSVPDSVDIMACEVNIRPPNESSMDFHHRLGFVQIGTLASDSGDKEVALLLKDL